jgi:hypothetical protein
MVLVEVAVAHAGAVTRHIGGVLVAVLVLVRQLGCAPAGDDGGQILVAINQETGPAEMRCQPEGAVEPLGEHAFGFRRLVSDE